MGSSASSITDSIVDEKAGASASQAKDEEKPEPPLIIHDNKEAGDKPSALLDDMPDVLSLPDPKVGGKGDAPLTKPPTGDEEKKL